MYNNLDNRWLAPRLTKMGLHGIGKHITPKSRVYILRGRKERVSYEFQFSFFASGLEISVRSPDAGRMRPLRLCRWKFIATYATTPVCALHLVHLAYKCHRGRRTVHAHGEWQ